MQVTELNRQRKGGPVQTNTKLQMMSPYMFEMGFFSQFSSLWNIFFTREVLMHYFFFRGTQFDFFEIQTN